MEILVTLLNIIVTDLALSNFYLRILNLMAFILKLLKCVIFMLLLLFFPLSALLFFGSLFWVPTILKINLIFIIVLKLIILKKNNNNSISRIFSLFNTGLFFFNLAFQSTKYVLLKCTFILYDV